MTVTHPHRCLLLHPDDDSLVAEFWVQGVPLTFQVVQVPLRSELAEACRTRPVVRRPLEIAIRIRQWWARRPLVGIWGLANNDDHALYNLQYDDDCAVLIYRPFITRWNR